MVDCVKRSSLMGLIVNFAWTVVVIDWQVRFLVLVGDFAVCMWVGSVYCVVMLLLGVGV